MIIEQSVKVVPERVFFFKKRGGELWRASSKTGYSQGIIQIGLDPACFSASGEKRYLP